ncbi:HNH endonuclease [Pseudomonas putida]|uniref:HNH endonuclease n=1 Tax=Pseudomonas putida TaxID=303 RepID=UPI000CD4470F|nr:hypothetical protein BGP83_17280 [Pseudomonas putida]
MLDHSDLKSLLDYNPETGEFTWRDKPCSRIIAGSSAGGYGAHGYFRVSVLGKRYYAHRLAWFYMTGAWPDAQIDHVNGVKSDNRFCNLREATPMQNNANLRRKPVNTSGYPGVSFDKIRGCWIARVRSDGRRHNLGRFATREEAYAARCEFAKKAHGQFYNPG